MSTIKIVNEILDEKHRQDDKFGQQNHTPMEWVPILTEELGEASKEALDRHFEYPVKFETLDGKVSVKPEPEDQRQRLLRYRAELIQLAAVTIQAIESLDRNEKPEQ